MKLREWTAAAVDPSEGPEPPAPEEWVAVAVPGSPERFAGERAVAYRTRFDDPGGMRALLRLRGLYAHARVWLNGEFVGSHDTYFTPFRTVFAPLQENELIVVCRAPEDRFGGVFQTPHVAPADCVPSIRWESAVEPVPETVITDLTIRPDDADETGVNAIVTVDTNADFENRIRLSLTPEGSDNASALSHVVVSADAGERVTVQGRLSVRDPDRWWPRGFGPQHRYTVRAALGESERTTKTGFRTVERRSEGLFVNGTRVPVRGRVALPDEIERGDAVENAVETNANLVRSHGFVPPEALYDAADAAGVFVFQDVPVSPGALDVERSRLVARTLAGEFSHHPSLATVGVHDDSYEFEATGEENGRRVLRATGEGGATTATAAATALPDTVPVMPVTEFDAPDDSSGWTLDGYSGTDREYDAGTHTRYVVRGTDAAAATRARRAIEALRLARKPLVTAFVRPGAVAAEETLTAGFEPVGVVLDDPTATEPHVVVCNDTSERVVADVEWRVDGETGTLPVDIGPTSRASVGEVVVPPDAHRIELSLSADERTVENTYELRDG